MNRCIVRHRRSFSFVCVLYFSKIIKEQIFSACMSTQHSSTPAISTAVSRALFSPSNVLNDSPLCFNKVCYFRSCSVQHPAIEVALAL